MRNMKQFLPGKSQENCLQQIEMVSQILFLRCFKKALQSQEFQLALLTSQDLEFFKYIKCFKSIKIIYWLMFSFLIHLIGPTIDCLRPL